MGLVYIFDILRQLDPGDILGNVLIGLHSDCCRVGGALVLILRHIGNVGV